MASIAPGMLTRSRSSSLSSMSRSPSRQQRSPSISSSSSSASSSHLNQLASDDDELAPTAPTTSTRDKVDPWTRRALKYGFDPRQLQPARCEWGNGSCGMEFWEVEPLVEHVHNLHAFPHDAPGAPPIPKRGAGSQALSYVCDWAGCSRRGKHQGSKFALVAHLRSHTGEKPFTCPRAECDKSFTRTDALQKHMRVQHGDKIVAAGRAPGSAAPDAGGPSSAVRAGAGRKGKGRGKRAREGSDDSAFGGPDDGGMGGSGLGGDDGDYAPGGGGGGGDAGGGLADIAYSPDEVRAIQTHVDLPASFVAHVVAKAKAAYVLREHEQLAHECEALSKRERELEMENDVLLRAILRREVGAAEDPAGRAALEQFLVSYTHEPAAYAEPGGPGAGAAATAAK
ncbi:hypothetical protein JCM3775_003959 [Rhodotorula graminis]